MNILKSKRLDKIVFGLAIAAIIAAVGVFIIGYLEDGSFGYLPIGIIAVIAAALLLLTRSRKSIDE